jgi:hypothetical protein
VSDTWRIDFLASWFLSTAVLCWPRLIRERVDSPGAIREDFTADAVCSLRVLVDSLVLVICLSQQPCHAAFRPYAAMAFT